MIPYIHHRKSIIFLIESEDLNKKMPQPLELDLENIRWKITVELTHALKGIIPINQISCSSMEMFHSKGAGKLIRKGFCDIVWAI